VLIRRRGSPASSVGLPTTRSPGSTSCYPGGIAGRSQRGSPAVASAARAATGTPLEGFAEGLGKDLAAVRAALETPWSTGPVEGQISRLKTIKRTMYGRAGFGLLRSRVLHAA